MAQFIEVDKWLQQKLDEIAGANKFKVSNERALDSDFEGEVVVSALSGTPYEESANIPYQIDVFSSDVEHTMDVLNTLSKAYSNVTFEQVIKVSKDGNNNDIYAHHIITPLINTPVVMEKDIPNGSQHFARIVVFTTFLVFYSVNDIKELEIDGEKINMLNSSLNYVIEPFSQRVSGQELNKSKKKASTSSINFEMVNKDSVFGNKAFETWAGTLKGNTGFTVKVTLSNNKTATMKMMIGSCTLGHSRGKLPSLNVAMFIYDDRGDQNNASS